MDNSLLTIKSGNLITKILDEETFGQKNVRQKHRPNTLPSEHFRLCIIRSCAKYYNFKHFTTRKLGLMKTLDSVTPIHSLG